MQLWRKLSYFGVLANLACAASSAPVPATTAPAPVTPGLRPGDAVQVDIWQEAELSGSFNVDANGTVVLPLLGEREVTGVPVSELERNLANEYREFLENPSVRVTVLRRIAIFGEVRNPNLYMVDATITLRDLLAMAGGILPSGNRDEIRLLRDGQVLVSSLDLNRQIGETPIQSGDQIEVGQQGWAARNRTWLTAVLGAVTTITVAYIWSR